MSFCCIICCTVSSVHQPGRLSNAVNRPINTVGGFWPGVFPLKQLHPSDRLTVDLTITPLHSAGSGTQPRSAARGESRSLRVKIKTLLGS